METLLVQAFFGHVVGDFFFQSAIMADNKYVPGKKGMLWCSVHVLVYTLSLAIFLGDFSPLFLLGVYVPHWIIDRWSLAYQWMKLIGRSDLIVSTDPKKASFGAIIYVVIDQTIHLGCLYVLLKYVQP